MKESDEIYHYESRPFALLEEEQKDLFMANLKKVVTGQIDQKLFALKFNQEAEDSSQDILYEGLESDSTEEWQAQMLLLVEKMLKDRQYEMDVVVTFVRGIYLRPVEQKSEYDIHENDTKLSNGFILCSINKTQDPKNELLFDYVEKEFKYNIIVDPAINLTTPLSGFLFPAVTDGVSDVNYVLYSAGKAYDLDEYFIEEVLTAEETMTAAEDKVVFEEIVKKVTGEQISTETLSNVYDEIHRVIEESEDDEIPTLNYRDIENMLTVSGVEDVEVEDVQDAFKTVIDDERFELKADNVLPKYTSKSIKIKTKVADVAIRPQDLKYVRQVVHEGKLNLMIEVEENTVIEGFEMIPELLFGNKKE